MNRIDPSFYIKLFPEHPVRPDLYPRFPGIDLKQMPDTDKETENKIKQRPRIDITDLIMARYDDLIYERALPLILKRMPALSREDLNYQQIKNLARSKIYQCKDDYRKLYRDRNWQMISDLLVMHIANTVISKYLMVKKEKMAAYHGAEGIKKLTYGDTTDGYFRVNGNIQEIPYQVADDAALPDLGTIGVKDVMGLEDPNSGAFTTAFISTNKK